MPRVAASGSKMTAPLHRIAGAALVFAAVVTAVILLADQAPLRSILLPRCTSLQSAAADSHTWRAAEPPKEEKAHPKKAPPHDEIPGYQSNGWKNYFTHFQSVCIVAPKDSPCPKSVIYDTLVFASADHVVAPTSCKGILDEDTNLQNHTFASWILNHFDYDPDLAPEEYTNCEALIFVLPSGPNKVVPNTLAKKFLAKALVMREHIENFMIVPFGWSIRGAVAGGGPDDVTMDVADAVGESVDDFLTCNAGWKILFEPAVGIRPGPHQWFLNRYRIQDTPAARLLHSELQRFHHLQKSKSEICTPPNNAEILPECKSRKYLVYKIHNAGFASVVRNIGYFALTAMHQNRTLIIERIGEGYMYADTERCPNNDLSCSFLPRESECSDYVHNQLKLGTPDELIVDTHHKDGYYDKSQQIWIASVYDHWDTVHEGAAKWWVDTFDDFPGYQFTEYYIQPRYAIRKAVMKQVAAQNLPSRYLSMHVRHGDKASEMQLMPFSDYMKFAIEYSQIANLNSIYIATDNQTVLNSAAQLYPDYDFHYLDFSRIGDTVVDSGQFIAPDELAHKERVLVNLWTDLTVMRNCDFFVGSFGSGFTKLVVEGRMAQWGEVLPAVMLGGGTEGVKLARRFRNSMYVPPLHFS